MSEEKTHIPVLPVNIYCVCDRPANCTGDFPLNKTLYQKCSKCNKLICGCDICGGSPSRYGDCGY